MVDVTLLLMTIRCEQEEMCNAAKTRRKREEKKKQATDSYTSGLCTQEDHGISTNI